MYLILLLVAAENTISPHTADFCVSSVPVLVSHICHECSIKKEPCLFYFILFNTPSVNAQKQ